MSTTAVLRSRLGEVTEETRSKRATAQQAWMRFDKARQRLAKDDSPDALAEAERASSEYGKLADELHALEQKRDTFWSLVPGARSVRKSGRLGERPEPGEWLASVVQRHALTTEEIGSVEDQGRVFFDRLRETSALMASGPTVVDLDTTSIKVPTLTDRLAPAPIVDELAEIPEVTVPLDLVEIKPPKLAQLTTLSKEAYTDARPVVLAANERELIGSIGSGFDLGGFHGAAGSAQVGLEHLSGVLVVDAANALTNLDPFVKGIGALRRARTRATAIYMNPATWERLALLKKGTDSNEPLVSGARAATDMPAEDILGVPVYQSEVIETAMAFVANAAELVVVRRTDVEVEIDPFYKFSSAGVGIRVIARAKLLPAQAKAVAIIENLPTA